METKIEYPTTPLHRRHLFFWFDSLITMVLPFTQLRIKCTYIPLRTLIPAPLRSSMISRTLVLYLLNPFPMVNSRSVSKPAAKNSWLLKENIISSTAGLSLINPLRRLDRTLCPFLCLRQVWLISFIFEYFLSHFVLI